MRAVRPGSRISRSPSARSKARRFVGDKVTGLEEPAFNVRINACGFIRPPSASTIAAHVCPSQGCPPGRAGSGFAGLAEVEDSVVTAGGGEGAETGGSKGFRTIGDSCPTGEVFQLN